MANVTGFYYSSDEKIAGEPQFTLDLQAEFNEYLRALGSEATDDYDTFAARWQWITADDIASNDDIRENMEYGLKHVYDIVIEDFINRALNPDGTRLAKGQEVGHDGFAPIVVKFGAGDLVEYRESVVYAGTPQTGEAFATWNTGIVKFAYLSQGQIVYHIKGDDGSYHKIRNPYAIRSANA